MSDCTVRPKLLPCPWCGKRQAIHREFGGWVLNTTSHDRKCIMRKLLSFGMAGGLVFDTEAEAIAAWNTRAERTCKLEHVKSGVMYDVWRYTCCGYEHAESVSDESVAPNYCPNCGARVEKVDV